MGCKNRRVLTEEDNAVSASLGDALLLATMCIIGLPVDVHVKDGSIYSGIFHTACIEDDYGVVLKRARMTKKGNSDANVAIEDVIETLLVLSEDLVQVVAKGVLLPANGVGGNTAGDNIGVVTGNATSRECPETEAKTRISRNSNKSRKHRSQARCSAPVEHAFEPNISIGRPSNTLEAENWKSDPAKKEEASGVPVNGRQAGADSERKQSNHEEKSDVQREKITHEVQGSISNSDACETQPNSVENIHVEITSNVLSNAVPCDSPAPFIVKLDDQCQEEVTSKSSSCFDAITSDVSTAVTSAVDVTSESCPSSSSTPTEMGPPKSSNFITTSKEFKLNPRAKMFSPSFVQHRSATPPAVATVANVNYRPDPCPVVPVPTPPPEAEISHFGPHTSLPVKFVPYNDMGVGNDSSDLSYVQPIVGHVGSRTQPVRYAGQYHPVQAGPVYVHPNSQNVMVGRMGSLVYMHPVSQDMVQGGAAVSQGSTRPLLTPHQVHLPKHQGNATTQALHECMTPPFIAGGQQPFGVPSHVPISQPSFPVIHPIPVPGSNSFLGSNFP